MRKLLLALTLCVSMISCSKDSDEPDQDYTSFVFHLTVDVNLPNCVAAHKDIDGKYAKLGDLGDLSKDKYSNEIIIRDENITDVYFFTDYNMVVRFGAVYKLTKNKKNVFTLLESTRGIEVKDKTDPYQYPQ